jgi:hypothetical protein
MPTLTSTIEFSALSTEYLTLTFTSDVDPQNITVPQMAFTTGHNDPPEEGDWETATIDGSTMVILIGPGTSVVLTAGFYLVWTRYDGGTEVPVEAVGYIRVF